MSELVCTCHCGGSMFYRHLHADSCVLSREGEEAPQTDEQATIATLTQQLAHANEQLRLYRASADDACSLRQQVAQLTAERDAHMETSMKLFSQMVGMKTELNDAQVDLTRWQAQLDTAQARVRELEAQLAAAQKVKADYDRWLSGGVYFTTAEYKKHVAEHRQQVEALQCELLKWKRALCNLTPGGSEFADDHAYCAEWVRKARENQQDIIMSKHRELKAAQAALNRLKAQHISELQTQLTQLQAMARALIYSDNAPEHVRAWFALRATLDATTPAGRQE